MSKQTSAIVEWIQNTPASYQQDITFLILFLGSDWLTSNIPTDSMAPTQDFIDWIESHAGDTNQNVSFVLAFRALIDFHIIRRRGTKEAWTKTRENIESMRTLAEEGKGDKRIISVSEDMLNKLPQREKDWLEICGRWNTLRAQELSDDAIEKWENDIAFSTPRPS